MTTLDSEARDRLRKDQFAYLDRDGGEPLPIHDAAHIRNAILRFNQTHSEKQGRQGACPPGILAAAKRHDIKVDPDENGAGPGRS